MHVHMMLNHFSIFGSVCASGTKLSRSFDLHHSGSDLQAVIKVSSRGVQGVFKGFSRGLQDVFKGSQKGLQEVFKES